MLFLASFNCSQEKQELEYMLEHGRERGMGSGRCSEKCRGRDSPASVRELGTQGTTVANEDEVEEVVSVEKPPRDRHH